MIRLGDFLLSGVALAGLEAGRSVNISLLRSGAHRAGGWKIRLGDRSGARRAGGWKIRLGPGNISLLRSGAHRAGGQKIRLGPGEYKSFKEWRSPGWRWKDPSRTWEYKSFKEWRSPGWRLEDPSRGAHRVGGGKIRLGPGNISLLGSGAHRVEAERSVSVISCSQERRSPGWRPEDPSRGPSAQGRKKNSQGTRQRK